METIKFTFKGELALFTFEYIGLKAGHSFRVECDHPIFKKAMLGVRAVRCDSVVAFCDDHLNADQKFFH